MGENMSEKATTGNNTLVATQSDVHQKLETQQMREIYENSEKEKEKEEEPTTQRVDEKMKKKRNNLHRVLMMSKIAVGNCMKILHKIWQLLY